MPDNASKTEPLTPDQKEIETILSTKKTRLEPSDLSYLELAVVFGKRVIRSKVSKARLFIEVKPGQWDYPPRLDPKESKLAHNPGLTRKDLDYLDEDWEAMGL